MSHVFLLSLSLSLSLLTVSEYLCIIILQATEVLKIILGRGNVLCGRVLIYNALKMSFTESHLVKTQVGVISIVVIVDNVIHPPASMITSQSFSVPLYVISLT